MHGDGGGTDSQTTRKADSSGQQVVCFNIPDDGVTDNPQKHNDRLIHDWLKEEADLPGEQV